MSAGAFGPKKTCRAQGCDADVGECEKNVRDGRNWLDVIYPMQFYFAVR
jgi:hypothetical protein